jgi:hypothetical protein
LAQSIVTIGVAVSSRVAAITRTYAWSFKVARAVRSFISGGCRKALTIVSIDRIIFAIITRNTIYVTDAVTGELTD